MSASEDVAAIHASRASQFGQRRLWDFIEVSVGYGLILAVIWTPRPLQHWLYWLALAWFSLSVLFSYPGHAALGFQLAGLWRSLWIVGVAATLAGVGIALANALGTLHHPTGLTAWVASFGGYAIWSLVQQFLLQGYFLLRLVRILHSRTWAALTAASVFALAHLPNPILAPVTLIWGLAACFIFLKFRNIWPLAIAHAIFGICIAITIPGPTVHNMRVGLGYLRYHRPAQPFHLSQSDHTASTVAWVMAEAPTRR